MNWLLETTLGANRLKLDNLLNPRNLTLPPQNHIWTKAELDDALNTLYRHKPQTFSDYLMNYFVSIFFLLP